MARLIQPTFNRGEISPELYGRVDTTAYVGGLATARNVHVHSYGGVSRRPGTRFIGPVKDHDYAPRLIEFQFKVSDTYILEFGDEYIRFIRDDGHVLTGEVNVSGATNANPVVVTATAHGFSSGNEVFFENVGGMIQLNQNRYIVDVINANSFRLLKQIDGTTFVDGSDYGTYTSGGTVAKVYEISSPYDIDDVWELDYTQSADVMTLVHPSYEPRELTRTDHDSWTLSTITFESDVEDVANLTVTPGTNNGVTWSYRVTSIDLDTGEESFGTAASTANGKTSTPDNTVEWDAVANVSFYRVYRAHGGGLAQVGLVSEVDSGSTSMLDTQADSAVDYTIHPPVDRNSGLFDAENEYPGAVGFYQQRRVFGGSNLDPDTSDYSQTGSFSNFNFSLPTKATDSIRATLNSQQVNQIRHYVGLNDLLILTSGSEWRINAGSENTFGPDTIRQFPQSNYGCSHYQPIVIGNTVLFVTEDLGNIRSFSYNLEVDGYRGNNLNILSRHLLDGYAIADWAYHRVPDPRIYIVRSDGTALTLSYDQEQELVAWTRMDTLGDFEAVQVLRGGGTFSEDSVYWVVKRRVNEETVRYIEVMRDTFFDDPSECFFVDCGLSYDSPITITNIEVDGSGVITVTAASHGLSNGDIVEFHDIRWETSIDTATGATDVPDHLNHQRYVVADAAANTFTLEDEAGDAVDGSDFAAYLEGGKVREAIATVTGLEHLEGEEVICLCDGNVIKGKTVTDASVSFDRAFSVIHIGLPNIAEIETLNIEGGQGTIQGMDKKVSNVTLRLFKTRGLLVGPDKDHLVEMKQRELEDIGEHTNLFSGDEKIYLKPSWNSNGKIFIRQKHPLPLTLLAVVPEFELSDP